MSEDDTQVATSKTRRQVEAMEAELEDVLVERRRIEVAVVDSRQKTQELLARSSNIATKQGNIRKQVAEANRLRTCSLLWKASRTNRAKDSTSDRGGAGAREDRMIDQVIGESELETDDANKGWSEPTERLVLTLEG